MGQGRGSELDVNLVLTGLGLRKLEVPLADLVVPRDHQRRRTWFVVELVLIVPPLRRQPIRSGLAPALRADAKVLNRRGDRGVVVKGVVQSVRGTNGEVDDLLHGRRAQFRVARHPVEHRRRDFVVHDQRLLRLDPEPLDGVLHAPERNREEEQSGFAGGERYGIVAVAEVLRGAVRLHAVVGDQVEVQVGRLPVVLNLHLDPIRLAALRVDLTGPVLPSHEQRRRLMNLNHRRHGLHRRFLTQTRRVHAVDERGIRVSSRARELRRVFRHQQPIRRARFAVPRDVNLHQRGVSRVHEQRHARRVSIVPRRARVGGDDPSVRLVLVQERGRRVPEPRVARPHANRGVDVVHLHDDVDARGVVPGLHGVPRGHARAEQFGTARQRRVDHVARDVRVVYVLGGKLGRVGAFRERLERRRVRVREVGVYRPVEPFRPRGHGERRRQPARGVVPPYRVHLAERPPLHQPDVLVHRHRLRPVGVVVARRERARGYRARQREHREQRRSRELGDGRAARGSASYHPARRSRRPTLSNLPARPASARAHRHSRRVPSPRRALGATPAESARVDLSAPGADAVGRVRSAMKVARCYCARLSSAARLRWRPLSETAHPVIAKHNGP